MKLHRSALRLALIYWICASLWVVFSDQLLFKLFGTTERMLLWHSAKGLAFVLVTSALLYALLNLYFSRMSLQHSARRANEASLRQAAAVFDSTLEGVLVTDTEQRIVHVNRAFQRITGYEEKEVMGKVPSMFQSGRHDDAFYQVMWKSLNQRGEWSGEIWNRRKSGEIFPIWQNLRAIHDENGELSHYVAVFSDITAIKRSQNELDHLAHHDPLTSLPNRLLFIERVESALKRIFADKRGGAVMVVDLDHFKHINESLGHNIGDQLLKGVAERLRGLLEDGMTLARMGGDEFALIYEDCPHVEQAAALATRILEEIKAPFSLGGHELFTGASIGISLYPGDARTVQQLLRNADSALFKAKSSGREGYAFYTQELTAYAHQRVELAASLRHALEGGQLRVYYQPVLRLSDGHIVGVEALVRWQHPERGLISPGEFIPIAEESGLIGTIDAWVLEESCRQMRCWVEQGRELEFVAVNISSRVFNRGDLPDRIVETLEKTGLEPARLELEVTESAIMHDPDGALDQLVRLRVLGVRLSIDDFGTGYSSLLRLKRLPVHKLKIDQGFVAGLPDESEDMAITRAVIALAGSLGLKVLAEGIETPEQAAFLLEHHCDLGQGYWFGRPVPAEKLDWRDRPPASQA
ncbi:EAL domain-containing protein [Pseudomonas kuykendallii]|uniref:cyclic-guanylate-specific phosphodiesterase n=1 Tax=Pseudomonas kuykendallii TaxID=1007099 RepID=A0A1H2SZL6_9PSED|nr:EAL domain-containing protein [Pseudomonas kuykendallii]MCQ4272547.1 EAL domain-containing protein [Pseudomonas kuykendallii]SDW37051.1 diguanylate cyclase/phosphodiesterase with PAS/PAC sensor(s) [Pseudomonas kuykendallii]